MQLDKDSELSKELKEAIEELKSEIVDSALIGKGKSEDTQLHLSIERVKKLKLKLRKFDSLVNEIREKSEIQLENKIKKLRENWKIEETEEEIKKLTRAIRLKVDI